MRIKIAVLTCFFAVTSSAALANDTSDWKYFMSTETGKIKTFSFYDAAGLRKDRAGAVQVWFKELSQEQVRTWLNKPVEQWPSDFTIEAAKRISDNYIPPMIKTTASQNPETTLATSLTELAANHELFSPVSRTLMAIDCSNYKFKLLQIITSIPDKKVEASTTETEWAYIAPETALSKLSALVCASQ